MTALRTPAKRNATPALKPSGEMVVATAETLVNQAAVSTPIARHVQAPVDEVSDAIPDPDAGSGRPKKATTRKVTAVEKATKPAATTHTSHTDCTHAKIGREGKAARAACRRERATAEAKA